MTTKVDIYQKLGDSISGFSMDKIKEGLEELIELKILESEEKCIFTKEFITSITDHITIQIKKLIRDEVGSIENITIEMMQDIHMRAMILEIMQRKGTATSREIELLVGILDRLFEFYGFTEEKLLERLRRNE